MAYAHFALLMMIAAITLHSNRAHPLDDLDNLEYDQYRPPSSYLDGEHAAEIVRDHRYVRSVQPGAPSFPLPSQSSNGGWKVDPSLSRGQDGNTRGSVIVQHTGPNHEVNAQVDKVIRGPGKSKPSYSIHGSWKF